MRPLYNRVLGARSHTGLERNINGTDRVFIAPHVRVVTEEYKPDVWASLMSELRRDDTLADVGAYYGLYAVAVAKRMGAEGRVVAFEPSAANRAVLQEHLRLNHVEEKVEVVAAAVGSETGRVSFAGNNFSESHVVAGQETAASNTGSVSTESVEMVTLDGHFAGMKLDILKIDVEGFEEQVLRGADKLLRDAARDPRVLYIEVHPFAWHHLGTTGESLLALLASHGFTTTFVDGRPANKIEDYGEIIARRTPPAL